MEKTEAFDMVAARRVNRFDTPCAGWRRRACQEPRASGALQSRSAAPQVAAYYVRRPGHRAVPVRIARFQ